MGEEALEVYKQTLPEEDKCIWQEVLKIFKNDSNLKENIVFEWHQFESPHVGANRIDKSGAKLRQKE